MSGANYDDLKRFRDKLNRASVDADKFASDVNKDIAGRLLSYVKPWTPVRDNRGPGGVIKGGTLRRGWTAKTHAEAYSDIQGGGDPNGPNSRTYAKGLPVAKSGNTYRIDIINPVEYAMYVEYGHRTRNGGGMGFVPGKHMLTKSIRKLEPQLPRIIDRKVQTYLDKLEEDT